MALQHPLTNAVRVLQYVYGTPKPVLQMSNVVVGAEGGRYRHYLIQVKSLKAWISEDVVISIGCSDSKSRISKRSISRTNRVLCFLL